MPLILADVGKVQRVKKIGGHEETRKFLEKLGLVVGGDVTVVSIADGNVIVNLRDSRVAIGRDMAKKIIV